MYRVPGQHDKRELLLIEDTVDMRSDPHTDHTNIIRRDNHPFTTL